VAAFSSRGPTAYDFAVKPDVAVPGVRILSLEAPGAFLPTIYPSIHAAGGGNNGYMVLSGTSMAAPVVCGVAAQMLAVERKLTSAQISGIMVRTSKPLPGTDYEWKNDSGFGVVSAQHSVDEANKIFIKTDLDK
jgi:subtilisin family serine protease